jgi:hypothetical protein
MLPTQNRNTINRLQANPNQMTPPGRPEPVDFHQHVADDVADWEADNGSGDYELVAADQAEWHGEQVDLLDGYDVADQQHGDGQGDDDYELPGELHQLTVLGV